jgi:hypothetical protein
VETEDFLIRIAPDGAGVPGIVAWTGAQLADQPDDACFIDPWETEAVITMKCHFASVAETQAAIEPYLRSRFRLSLTARPASASLRLATLSSTATLSDQ